MHNRQYYIIPKPIHSLWNASNCLSIISGLLSRTIWSIGKTNLQWIEKLSGDAQALSFEINNNRK
jgi:pyruvate/2-oxoacid:ferredoxin oxidoreductase beta subunit